MLAHLRTKLSAAWTWVGNAATRVGWTAPTVVVVPVLEAIAFGAGVWAFRRPERLAELNGNKVPEPERLGALKWVAVCILGALVLHALVAIGRRLVEKSWRWVATSDALNRWLAIVVATPFVAMLRVPNIEKDSPKLAMVYAAIAAAACVPTLLAAAGVLERLAADRDDDVPRVGLRAAVDQLGRWGPLVVVLLIWAWYGWFFSNIAVTNHHALHTRTTDLGYYDNIFYQSAHGRPLQCSYLKGNTHTTAHFDPILVVLAPLYLLHPRAEFLLVLQTVWLGAGAVPVYLLARARLGSSLVGVALAGVWALYPALHGANMYEFHSLTLVAPVVVWLLYFLETGKTALYWVAFLVAVLVREDVPLLLCFVGAYALLTRRRGDATKGMLTIVFSLAYFVIVKKKFMASPDLFNQGQGETYGFAYYFDAMIPTKDDGGKSLVTSLLTNPVFALKVAMEEAKFNFLLLLFLPLGLLPFFARKARIMLVYGLTFCLLASRAAVYTIHFQYSTMIFSVAFVGAVVGLAQLADTSPPSWLGGDGKRLVRVGSIALLVLTGLLSWKFGGLAQNSSFRGGFVGVARSLTDDERATYAWIRQQTATIPVRAQVAATPKLGPHVSNRRYAFAYPERNVADYLFIDESELKAPELEKLQKAAQDRYVEVARRNKMVLLKKK